LIIPIIHIYVYRWKILILYTVTDYLYLEDSYLPWKRPTEPQVSILFSYHWVFFWHQHLLPILHLSFSCFYFLKVSSLFWEPFGYLVYALQACQKKLSQFTLLITHWHFSMISSIQKLRPKIWHFNMISDYITTMKPTLHQFKKVIVRTYTDLPKWQR
jgi:hypothetical protein